MNEVLNAILDRRSIRKYKQEQIPDSDRDLIVKAGLYAASSKNTQPWHVTVVQNREKITKLTEEVKAAIIRAKVEKYLGMANSPKYTVNFGAPTFIIVSGNPAASNCVVEDCSLVLGNMFLAAYSLGIGSCWVNQLGCVSDEPGFRAVLTELGIPPENKVYGAAAFGYNADSHPKALPRKNDTVDIIS